MSFPKYITNIEEFNLGIKEDLEVSAEFSDDLKILIEDYMTEILDLLGRLLGRDKQGLVQKVIGLHEYIPALNFDFEIKHVFEEDVVLTGITYSQTGWKVCDTWDLYINDTILFENIYTKELAEYKHLNAFCTVKAGNEVKFIHHNNSGNSKQIWWDIHYLGCEPELSVPEPEPILPHEYDYILKIKWNNAHRLGAAWVGEDFKTVLINNYSSEESYQTSGGGVWVDESYGMDGELSDGEATYSLKGKPNKVIYFAVQRCPYCDACDYIKISIEKRNGEIAHSVEIEYPNTMDIIKAQDIDIGQDPSVCYTPIFEFDFSEEVTKITPLWL